MGGQWNYLLRRTEGERDLCRGEQHQWAVELRMDIFEMTMGLKYVDLSRVLFSRKPHSKLSHREQRGKHILHFEFPDTWGGSGVLGCSGESCAESHLCNS
jgi:hypothetical protein